MEDRKRRLYDLQDLRPRLATVVRKMAEGQTLFSGVHVCTPHGDVPDNSALRLVLLIVDKFYSKQEPRFAFGEVLEFIKNNGQKPRHKGNRLIFLAADLDSQVRLKDALRTALAWKSIADDVDRFSWSLFNASRSSPPHRSFLAHRRGLSIARATVLEGEQRKVDGGIVG